MHLRLLGGLLLLLMLTSCNLFGPAPQPILGVNSRAVDLSSTGSVQTIRIFNDGAVGSTLTWSITKDEDASWLTVTPDSGTVPSNTSRTVQLYADQSSFDLHQKATASLHVMSNGGTATVVVQFERTSMDMTGGTEMCGRWPARTEATARISAAEEYVDPSARFVPDQIVVSLSRQGQGSTTIEAFSADLFDRYGARVIARPMNPWVLLVEVPAGTTEEAFAALLRNDPRVEHAEPNYYVRTQASTNDPLLSQQWNIKEFGVERAWSQESGSSEIVIAIIDSGVDMYHEDLRAKMLPGCNFHRFSEGGGSNDPNPGTESHGTHVAGIAAAVGNNGLGIAGVAHSGVKILPIRVTSGNSNGTSTLSDIAAAIRWAAGIRVAGVADNPYPARVINISMGVEQARNDILNAAVADATNAGALVIAAAGNSGSSQLIHSPANAPQALAVGSVGRAYERSCFSSYSTTGRTVDVMAPGGNSSSASCRATSSAILSTFNRDQYGSLAGTSMATPFVAGVAALVLSQDPTLTVDEVRTRIVGNTYFDGDMNSREYGFGVVCADAALGAPTTCGR